MGGEMCDQETKDLFEKSRRRDWYSNFVATCILAVAGWAALQLYYQGQDAIAETKDRESLEQQFLDHRADFNRLITLIPDGFFTKERYGTSDAQIERRFNELERNELAKRIAHLERLSTSHIDKSDIYIKMIQDTATTVAEMQKILWRLMPDEIK